MPGSSLPKLKRAYVLGLGFVAVILILAYLLSLQVIKTQETSAWLVNVSGKQRMLSQEIALLGLELVVSTDPSERENLRTEIRSSVGKMRANFGNLVQDSGHLSEAYLFPVIEAIYFQEPLHLEKQIKNYTSAALALANEPDPNLIKENLHLQYLLSNKGMFRAALDQAVNQYQLESERKVNELQKLETIFVGIILLVLIIEAVYVFRPLTKIAQLEKRELEAANACLRDLSNLDGLTGIANRRYFDEYLNEVWVRSGSSLQYLTLIMCDIDSFKAFNDHYGHQEGDECLKAVASALKDMLKREGDLVARYGGEEFVVVLPNVNPAGALVVAENLRAGIEGLQIPHSYSSASGYVTISLGVASTIPDLKADPSVLIKLADQALYQAKNEGRNRLFFRNPDQIHELPDIADL